MVISERMLNARIGFGNDRYLSPLGKVLLNRWERRWLPANWFSVR